MKKINKWLYVLVIQGYYAPGYGWEDVSEYDLTDRKQARADLKEYRLGGTSPHRLIKRRVLNPEWRATNKEEVLKAQTQEEARQFAVDWQHWQSGVSMSWGELVEWQDVFNVLAAKFDLLEEFKENGIL